MTRVHCEGAVPAGANTRLTKGEGICDSKGTLVSSFVSLTVKRGLVRAPTIKVWRTISPNVIRFALGLRRDSDGTS